jgi:hypothetical protein
MGVRVELDKEVPVLVLSRVIFTHFTVHCRLIPDPLDVEGKSHVFSVVFLKKVKNEKVLENLKY